VSFKGLGELSEEGLGGFDKGGKSSLLVSQTLLLVFEGGKEGFPISLGLFFSTLGDFLFFNDTLSDVVKEI